MLKGTRDIEELNKICSQIRVLIIKMLSKAGSGHPGGSLSAVEVVVTLFFSVMRHDPKNPQWPERDRFHLSKGHGCPVVYAALAKAGYFEERHLWELRRLGALLQGHPHSNTPGIEVSSGSLGQGLGIATGMSLAGRLDNRDYRVYCLLGDGECQEGNIWESAMAASHFGCDNLCAILDYNKFQIDGSVKQIMNLEPIEDKWKAFGWHTIVVDGHSIEELLNAFDEAKQVKGKPSIIIAHTIKGKGVSFMEGTVDFHGRSPNKEEEERALRELLEDGEYDVCS